MPTPWSDHETGLEAARPERLPGLRFPVRARFFDQRFEEREVFARFRVPEDAEREAAGGGFQRFDGAIGGARGLFEPFAEAPEALVVVGLHVVRAPEHACEPRSVAHLDAVVGEDAVDLLVRIRADAVR